MCAVNGGGEHRDAVRCGSLRCWPPSHTHVLAAELGGGALGLLLELNGALGGHVGEARLVLLPLGLDAGKLRLPLGLFALGKRGSKGRSMGEVSRVHPSLPQCCA